jgi:phage-related protein
MADFTGFYLDGIHSSTYGILRVSDGDRYKEGLIPEFEDREIELSGGSGSIYVNTQYKKTPFDIEIAFDHLTEQQFRDMRKWLGGEKLHSFQFDERPYKTYWVKLESRPELEYVCFMEKSEEVIGQEERIYKGEGELKFVAYDPFGYCCDETVGFDNIQIKDSAISKEGVNWQELKSYNLLRFKDDNLTEWAESSGLKRSLEGYNNFESARYDSSAIEAKLYNPGDFETDYQLLIESSGDLSGILNFYITLDPATAETGNTNTYLSLFKLQLPENGTWDKLLIDTKKHTVITYKNNDAPLLIKTLRYDLVQTSSTWDKIPKGESYLKIQGENVQSNKAAFKIKYNYKYY